MGTKHELSSAHHHESNAQAESAVKQCEYLLLKTGGKFNSDFKKALRAYRNTPRESGYSPAMLFFGRRQRTELPVLPSHRNAIDFSQAEKNLRASAISQKTAHDKRSKGLPPLSIDSQVYMQDPLTKRWDAVATVVESRESGQSYVVNSNGRNYLRNRIFLRPVSGQPRKHVRFADTIRIHKY